MNTRQAALKILLNITKDKVFTNHALDNYFKTSTMEKRDRAFIKRLVEGTIEYMITLDHIIDQYSKLKTKKIKPVILMILRMSVYQLLYLSKVPESAICNEAVKLTRKRGFQSLTGFVNGVLRTIIRNKDRIVYPDEIQSPIDYLSICYAFPKWMIELWLKQFDYKTVKAICKNSHDITKTCIRTNTTLLQPSQLQLRLEKEGVYVENGHLLDYAFHISGYDHLAKLNTFQEGCFQVQDESSMLVTEIADPAPGNLVIDVCAAPGGKATHVAQVLSPNGRVIARDVNDKKVELIRDNVHRLKLTNVSIDLWDATDLDDKLIHVADRVICDVPCSGLGIIRKKSDIKYHLNPQQLKDLIELQRKILDISQRYVKKQGFLIYSTCTIHSGENEHNVEWFLKHYDFELVDIEPILPRRLKEQQVHKGYLQLLPEADGTDGFFIAKFKKN